MFVVRTDLLFFLFVGVLVLPKRHQRTFWYMRVSNVRGRCFPQRSVSRAPRRMRVTQLEGKCSCLRLIHAAGR